MPIEKDEFFDAKEMFHVLPMYNNNLNNSEPKTNPNCRPETNK